MSSDASQLQTTALEEFIKGTIGDDAAYVRAAKDDLGWIRIYITTTRFAGLSNNKRLELVEDVLQHHGLSVNNYPIGGIRLYAPGESQQDDKPFPFWSDALLEPTSSELGSLQIDPPLTTPSTVAFYSFKGGVGRSTALAFTASLLARQNYRVAIIDLDLEAPGLSFFLERDAQGSVEGTLGVLDYLYQRLLTPEEALPKLSEIVVPLEYSDSGRGEILLIPAGRFDEAYIHKLADLSWRRLYQSASNPMTQLLSEIRNELKPDVILIDARTGFADEGAVSLMDLSDACVLCLTPTTQNYEGLAIVLRALSRVRTQNRRHNVKFLLTPLPALPEEIRKSWLNNFQDWVQENWTVEKGQRVEDLFCTANYNPNILTLGSYLNDVPSEFLDPYQPLVEFIATGLPPTKSLQTHIPSVVAERIGILDELQTASFTSAAQDIQTESLPQLFQRTGDFPKFLRKSTWLTLGAKGTGKSVLFRLFVETPTEAVKLTGDALSFKGVLFAAAHGKSTTSAILLSKDDLTSFTKAVSTHPDFNWQSFWAAYAAIVITYKVKKLLPEGFLSADTLDVVSADVPSHSSAVDWLVLHAANPSEFTKVTDLLGRLNHWLEGRNEYYWLFYDELDVAFDAVTRGAALAALLEWWLETGVRFQRFVPKILLRKDIWETISFTNKAHYFSKVVSLEWEEDDLWRLALRRTTQASSKFAAIVSGRFGATLENLDNFSLAQLRDATGVIWGTRMGKTQKAYSYNWVRTRISDARKDAFPRSLGTLLETAIKRERDFNQAYSEECLLRPRSLIDSIDLVSAQRVEEVRAEYPDLIAELDALREERSPIDSTRLASIWALENGALADKILAFVKAGIFESRSSREQTDEKVYGVAELYLYGLGMKRKGQK